MDEKRVPPSLEAVLAHVHPDRRKFLGLMLTGAAAIPLLRSAALAAEEKTGSQTVKAPKDQTVKGPNNQSGKFPKDQTIKSPGKQTIKAPNAQGSKDIKFEHKGTTDIKLAPGASSQIKGATPGAKAAPNEHKAPRPATQDHK